MEHVAKRKSGSQTMEWVTSSQICYCKYVSNEKDPDGDFNYSTYNTSWNEE